MGNNCRISLDQGRVTKWFLDPPEAPVGIPSAWAASHEAAILQRLADLLPGGAPLLLGMTTNSVTMSDAGIPLRQLPRLLPRISCGEPLDPQFLAVGRGLLQLCERMARANVICMDPNPGNVCIGYMDGRLVYQLAQIIDHAHTHLPDVPLDKPVFLATDADINPEIPPEGKQWIAQGLQHAAAELGMSNDELYAAPQKLYAQWAPINIPPPNMAAEPFSLFLFGAWLAYLLEECQAYLNDNTVNLLQTIVEQATRSSADDRAPGLKALLDRWDREFPNLPTHSGKIARPAFGVAAETSMDLNQSSIAQASSGAANRKHQTGRAGIAANSHATEQMPRKLGPKLILSAVCLFLCCVVASPWIPHPSQGQFEAADLRKELTDAIVWLETGQGPPPTEALKTLVATSKSDLAYRPIYTLLRQRVMIEAAKETGVDLIRSSGNARLRALHDAGDGEISLATKTKLAQTGR